MKRLLFAFFLLSSFLAQAQFTRIPFDVGTRIDGWRLGVRGDSLLMVPPLGAGGASIYVPKQSYVDQKIAGLDTRTTVIFGTLSPGSGLGVNGQLYFRQASAGGRVVEMLKKVSGTWVSQGIIPDPVVWNTLDGKPNTLAGFGITDGVASSRKVAGKPLSSDITLAPSDIQNLINLLAAKLDTASLPKVIFEGADIIGDGSSTNKLRINKATTITAVTTVPTSAAVKNYVDGLLSAINTAITNLQQAVTNLTGRVATLESQVTSGNTTPAAPTGGSVDDANNTYDWTANPTYPALSDQEYTMDGGTTITTVTAKPLIVGNVAKAIGQIGVRVKAATGRNVSAWLFNSTAFTVTSTNAAPVASAVTITGTLTQGNVVTGSWTYADAESNPQGTPTVQWYRADNSSGTNRIAISGATANTYTLTASDAGKVIQFGVIPTATAGTSPGVEALSGYTATIAVAAAGTYSAMTLFTLGSGVQQYGTTDSVSNYGQANNTTGLFKSTQIAPTNAATSMQHSKIAIVGKGSGFWGYDDNSGITNVQNTWEHSIWLTTDRKVVTLTRLATNPYVSDNIILPIGAVVEMAIDLTTDASPLAIYKYRYSVNGTWNSWVTVRTEPRYPSDFGSPVPYFAKGQLNAPNTSAIILPKSIGFVNP